MTEEMLQLVAEGVLRDMEAMLAMGSGKIKERTELPPVAVRKTSTDK